MRRMPYGIDEQSEEYRAGWNAALEWAARKLTRAKYIPAASELVLSLRCKPKGKEEANGREGEG